MAIVPGGPQPNLVAIFSIMTTTILYVTLSQLQKAGPPVQKTQLNYGDTNKSKYSIVKLNLVLYVVSISYTFFSIQFDCQH